MRNEAYDNHPDGIFAGYGEHEEEPKDVGDYRFPVYATQGGGLARFVGDTLIFVTEPDCPGLGVGDEVPEEWSFVAVNELARQEIEGDFFGGY